MSRLISCRAIVFWPLILVSTFRTYFLSTPRLSSPTQTMLHVVEKSIVVWPFRNPATGSKSWSFVEIRSIRCFLWYCLSILSRKLSKTAWVLFTYGAGRRRFLDISRVRAPPPPPLPPPPVFHDVIIISIITSISINVITIITSLFLRKILGPPSPSCYPPFIIIIIIIVNCPWDGGVRMEPFDMMFAAQSGHLNAVLGFVTFCDRSQTGSCSRCGFRSVCQFVS